MNDSEIIVRVGVNHVIVRGAIMVTGSGSSSLVQDKIVSEGTLAENVSAGHLLWRNSDGKLEDYDFTKDPVGVAGFTLSGGLAGNTVEYVISGEITDAIIAGDDGVMYVQSDGTVATTVPSSGYYWVVGARKNNIVRLDIDQDNAYVIDQISTVNHAPIVTCSDDVIINEGESTTVTCTATDADGDNLTYTWTDENGIVVANTSNYIIPDNLSVGVHQYTCTVSDGNVEVSDTVIVTVEQVGIQPSSADLVIEDQILTSLTLDGTELLDTERQAFLVTEGGIALYPTTVEEI